MKTRLQINHLRAIGYLPVKLDTRTVVDVKRERDMFSDDIIVVAVNSQRILKRFPAHGGLTHAKKFVEKEDFKVREVKV